MKRPPLPTPQQIAGQWAPSIDGIAKLFAKMQPGNYPEAKCAGKAPNFDTQPLPDETEEEYKERQFWALKHCLSCVHHHECAEAAKREGDAAGYRPGVFTTYRRMKEQ